MGAGTLDDDEDEEEEEEEEEDNVEEDEDMHDCSVTASIECCTEASSWGCKGNTSAHIELVTSVGYALSNKSRPSATHDSTSSA
jgi:hypothetical protein